MQQKTRLIAMMIASVSNSVRRTPLLGLDRCHATGLVHDTYELRRTILSCRILCYPAHLSTYPLFDITEVVSIGRPQKIASWSSNCRAKSYGGFVDAVCDKVYVVPCWIFLLSTIPGTRLRAVQYATLCCLILAEAASGTVRFRAYFTAQGVQAPSVVGLDFSTSAVKVSVVWEVMRKLMVSYARVPWYLTQG